MLVVVAVVVVVIGGVVEAEKEGLRIHLSLEKAGLCSLKGDR